jgi:hypothetical protein
LFKDVFGLLACGCAIFKKRLLALVCAPEFINRASSMLYGEAFKRTTSKRRLANLEVSSAAQVQNKPEHGQPGPTAWPENGPARPLILA